MTVRISGGKFSSGAFSRILESLCAVPPAGLLPEVFLRGCITSAGTKIFQRYGMPFSIQVGLLI